MGRLLGRYLRGYVAFIVAICVLTPIEAIANLMLPNLMSDIINVGIASRDMGYICQQGLVMAGWSVIAALSAIAASYLAICVSMGFGRDIRGAVFRRIESLSPEEFDSFGTSSLITRTTNDSTQLERFVSSLLGNGVMAPFMFIGAIVLSLRKSIQLSIALLVAVAAAAAFIACVVHFGLPIMRALQSRIDRLNLVTRENLTGMRVIRAFNRQRVFERRFDDASSQFSEGNIDVVRVMGVLVPGIILLLNLATVAIIWTGGVEVCNGGLLIGDLMAIIEYAAYVSTSIMLLSLMFSSLPRAVAASERIGDVLGMLGGADSRRSAAAGGTASASTGACAGATGHEGGIAASRNRGEIVFDDTTFSYTGADSPALEHVDIRIPTGQHVAIVGSTGSGKSTLLGLLLRFNEPTDGSIRLGGVDISDVDVDALRTRLSYVPQRARLFSGTVADNIRAGRPDASREDVEDAARAACADEFIARMDCGYDALIAEGGSSLSGGQRQRIALARALVRDADVYLFDDPLSALDFETELVVRRSLKMRLASSTSIMVTQRIGVARDADRIIVLDDGRVVGDGSHDELLASCKVYRQIAASQMDGILQEAQA